MEERECSEECGIAGVCLKGKRTSSFVPESLRDMLVQLQHRGQLSAGAAVYHTGRKGKRIKILKEIGAVGDLYRERRDNESQEVMSYLRGVSGIGHVRYATSGATRSYLDSLEEAQPFLRDHGRPWKRFAIAFNGNLANYSYLRRRMLREGYILDTKVDTEILMNLFALNLNLASIGRRKPDLFEVAGKVMRELDGAYSVVMQFGDGDLLAFRDHLGFKPFVWGAGKGFFAVASESVALEKIGINRFFPIQPGNCMIFNKEGVKERKIISARRKAHCHFERVYFARADSIVDGVSIDDTRRNLGTRLAKEDPLRKRFARHSEEYCVVPVPDTAIPAAEGYSRESGIALSLALTKSDRKRGFINKSKERERIMSRKYGLIKNRVRGKKIILIEDSVVRGETSKRVVRDLRDAGVLEVHLRSTEPPIKHPCFYGIDFPSYNELIATDHSNLEIARRIGADSIHYQKIEGLVASTGFKKEELCLACVNGEYPTLAGEKNSRELREKR